MYTVRCTVGRTLGAMCTTLDSSESNTVTRSHDSLTSGCSSLPSVTLVSQTFIAAHSTQRKEMAFRFTRKYVGPLKAAILDWSGTTADKYVMAPAVVFTEVFKKQGVPISMQEARGPMGLRKDLHIKALTENPAIRTRWFETHGQYPDQTDVDEMFADFVPTQLACLPQYSQLIPGCADAVNTLKKDLNMKIGSTTGFTKVMVEILLEEAKKQGYEPDASVAGDEVYHGARPRPFMVYRKLDLLDVTPIQSVVKVDDTVSGIGEALNAGCWGVGVTRYSNYMDIDSLEQEAELTVSDIERRQEVARDILTAAGAHYVVDSIADLPDVCIDINQRLARGDRP